MMLEAIQANPRVGPSSTTVPFPGLGGFQSMRGKRVFSDGGRGCIGQRRGVVGVERCSFPQIEPVQRRLLGVWGGRER